MLQSAPHLSCYLVEWYGPQVIAQPLEETLAKLDSGIDAIRAEGSTVQLLIALTAHTDQVLYSVFAASSPEMVRQACERAGFPAERVTGGIELKYSQKAV